jgi:hypothetical protein
MFGFMNSPLRVRQGPVSQRSVEQIIGKLATDPVFCRGFFRDPEAAALRLGVELSPEETNALLSIPRPALADFSARLDDRICRLHVGPCDLIAEYTP